MALLAGAPDAPAVSSFIGMTTGSADAAGVCTVTGVAIGAAAANRRVFMIVYTYGGSSIATLNSATIGGVAADIHAQNKGLNGVTSYGAAIISALVPTGTTATVVLTYSTTGITPRLATYRVTGLKSAVALSAISTLFNAGSPYNGTINVTNKGVLFVGATLYSAATGYTLTGANSDNGTASAIAGSLNVTADELNRAISIARFGGGGTGFFGPIIAVSFR